MTWYTNAQPEQHYSKPYTSTPVCGATGECTPQYYQVTCRECVRVMRPSDYSIDNECGDDHQ